MCAGNELFFVLLYVAHHAPGPVGMPGQPASQARPPAEHIRRRRGWGAGAAVDLGIVSLPLSELLAYVTLPVCVVKQGLSVIQLVGAAQALADLDRSNRAASRGPTKATTRASTRKAG
jgi:hypothetical protein